jgi:hypothetical protein
MKNGIIRELMKRLANAPAHVAEQYLKELSDEDRKEAERLVKALGIDLKEVDR